MTGLGEPKANGQEFIEAMAVARDAGGVDFAYQEGSADFKLAFSSGSETLLLFRCEVMENVDRRDSVVVIRRHRFNRTHRETQIPNFSKHFARRSNPRFVVIETEDPALWRVKS